DLRDLHDFADRQQVEFVSRFAKQLESLEAHPLETVRRTARLKRSAAKHAGSRLGNLLADIEKLLARLNRAGPCHDDHFFAANFQAIGKFDDRAIGPETSPRQLVGSA